MKALYSFPPVAAIGILAVWLTSQETEITHLEERITMLRKKVEVVQSAPVEGETFQTLDQRLMAQKKENKFLTKEGKIDWEAVGEQSSALQRGQMDGEALRAFMELQSIILEMDAAELVAAMEEIKTMGLPAEIERNLLGSLTRPLAEKDPAQILKSSEDLLSGDALSWSMRDAFGKWLIKDAAAAESWFERMVEAGKFDSKALNPNRGNLPKFEAKLLSHLLKEDPKRMMAKFDEMTSEKQISLLESSYNWELDEKSLPGYADLVREHLPEETRARQLGKAIAGKATNDGFEEVDKAMDVISASPEEREMIIERTASRYLNRWNRKLDHFETLNDWLGKAAPEKRVEIGAKVLAGYAQNGDNSEAVMKKLDKLGDSDLTAAVQQKLDEPSK